MSDRSAVAWCDVEDILGVRPDLSKDQGEHSLEWLESNATWSDRPNILKILIREAAESLGIGDEEEE